MEAIKIEVTGNIAKVIEKPLRITSGTVGLPVEFVFDSHWDNMTKVAVFNTGIVIKNMKIVDNATVVPIEALAVPGLNLSIGVYGVSEDGAVATPTVWASVGQIRHGAVPGSSFGSDIGTAKKYYDLGEQAAEKADASAKKAEEAAERAEAAADRAESAGGGAGNAVLYTPQPLSEEQKAQAKENIGASTFYHTKREPLVIDGTTDSDKKADADYIWGLYNDLMEDYSDEVKKLVWIDETASWSYEWEDYKPADGTFINYVYEISTREYPTDGLYANAYEADPQIKKPKYLILSGIHGDERKTCLSTYKFVRDVLRGHNVPQSFREGVTLCVMPVGTPSAINAFNRPNENAVDINRNFDWHWVSATKTDKLYGTFTYGTTAASEKETQAITNWLASHTDAELFIDYHNSGQINEQVVIMGLADTQKKIAMRGIDRIIPYWKDVIGYPKTMKLSSGEKKVIFSYTATAEIAGAHCYAQEVLGINSLAMETAVFYPNGDLTHADFLANRHLCPPETIAMGAEALGNILIEFYNHADMASQAGTPIYNGESVLNINTKTHARYNGEVE